ncbi:MAG: PAC2 family protein [Actinomycetota bacterium]
MAPLYELTSERPLAAPVLIAAFDGWVDAAGAATAAAAHLAGEGEFVARFDPDVLYDFRSRRPVLDIVDGRLHELTWPELVVRRVTLAGRDILVLAGAEPDYRWRSIADAVLELCVRLGVSQWISIGAIPQAVPHTRPTGLIATESQDGLLADGEQRTEGLLRVPAAALSVVEMTVAGSGIPTVGFFAQVPHYIGGEFTAATITLLDKLASHLDVPIDLGELADEASSERSRLDELLADRPETKDYVAQLETVADDEERVPSGDEIAAEIERFLQQNEGG